MGKRMMAASWRRERREQNAAQRKAERKKSRAPRQPRACTICGVLVGSHNLTHIHIPV